MKYLLILLFLLLPPTSSMAVGLKEPVYPPYCWVQPPNNELWYPCDSKEGQDANCLQLMELAMRAIDGHLNNVTDDKELSKSMKLWERAKTTCWPELRDTQPQHYH